VATIVFVPAGTVNEKFPSKSVTVPTDVLPFKVILTPVRGSSFLSTTFPVITVPFCAYAAKQINSRSKLMQGIFQARFVFIIHYY
jgi:hypothetical protein